MRSKLFSWPGIILLWTIALLLFSQNGQSSSVLSSQLPPGALISFAGATCPVGSIEADGSSLLRAGKYASLFAATGTIYGTADGTHFNLPDLRGKFERGWSHGTSNDPDRASRTACNAGGATGDNVGSCEADQFKAHTHLGQVQNGAAASFGGIIVWKLNTGSPTDPTSSSGGNETRPLNVYVLYCVKY